MIQMINKLFTEESKEIDPNSTASLQGVWSGTILFAHDFTA